MSTDEDGQVIEYRANDGARAATRVFRADEAAAPVVICLPAMGVRGRYYVKFAQALSRAGLHAITSDLRGIGSSSVRASRACDFGYKEILDLDMPPLLHAVRERFPANTRLLLGHSLGGQLSALYLSAHPDAAAGVILIAACNVHYKGWPAPMSWRVLGMAVLLRMLGAALGHVPAGKLGFAGNEARTVIVDWSNNCFSGRYIVANSDHDYEHSLKQMAKPILAMSFESDNLAPPRSVDNFLGKLAASRVTTRHFSHNHPGLEKARHFDWAKRPKVVVETIRTWVDQISDSDVTPPR
jgi:predicted alpha/beta hydrolase